MKDSPSKSLNNSVSKAFILLEHFTPNKSDWGVRELAQTIGANKSTTYRLMATLESLGVLQKNPTTERYSLGLKLFELGNRVKIQSALINQTHPELKKVASEITETVHLGIFKNNQVFMLDKVESPMGLKLNSIVGMSNPAYCSGIGKVLLAYQKPEKLKDILNSIQLIPKTDYTITNKTKLKKELIDIKDKGYAIDRQELELGLICVAVPIYNQQNEVIAALSAAGPADRFREEALDEYIATLQKGANAIKNKIGNFQIEVV